MDLQEHRRLLSKVALLDPKVRRVLDFDIETVAAGFADPEWVPQKITCVAWSFVGEEEVHVRVCGPAGLFGRPQRRAKMLKPLLAAIHEADMLTGHNITRFDLPVLNAECLRLGLPCLPSKLVQDTIKLVKTKGFKKGQDNIARLQKIEEEKKAMDWQHWQDAYDEDGWPQVIERCVTDIIQHKAIRAQMIEDGWLRTPRVWNPR